MNGLLINGELVQVEGVNVIAPHEQPWAYLSPGDCIPRARWPQQLILHKTLADDPEFVLAGKGPAGGAESTARFWQQKKPDGSEVAHSGAHLVTGDDGVVACLADLVRIEAYDANQSNPYSIGYETREKVGGGCFQAAYSATIDVVMAIIEHVGIQLQIPRSYKGQPLKRFADGGRSLFGIFGHRDVTTQRGKWDPGELLFSMLEAKGAERFDFDADEDRKVWAKRQEDLNAKGHGLVVDGLPGPATRRALLAEGYRGGVFALGRA